ncbi:MAG TPA: DUF3570 domain-containing protein, partial [Kofleriaceae bacterium]|nr:DUF3570 domain-containing protein [Kofleriaceae bacterium]
MQLIRTFALVVAMTAVAAAQAPGETPTAPAPPPAPETGSDTPTTDDYRDVLGGEKPTSPESSTTASTSDDVPVTGTGRFGVYHDSDATTVIRGLATAAKEWGHWAVSATAVVDAVTSASVDVKTSPALGKVDVITGASGQSSKTGGEMSDTRYLGTVGVGWNDTSGHALNLTTSAANERDYESLSAGLNGSIDVADRNVTLLGGFTVTDNWVSSVLDSTLHHKMYAIGWSSGVARVLTPTDAVRLRYDGKLSEGYQASPYRSVRFGDWTTKTLSTGQITFANTIGSADGLPEKLPETRLGTALTGEWVHALALGIGLHTSVRAAHDSWGVDSLTPALDLRIAKATWRLQLGYRLYLQSRASFFNDKYTMDPAMYANYSSDKELGRQTGHLGSF